MFFVLVIFAIANCDETPANCKAYWNGKKVYGKDKNKVEDRHRCYAKVWCPVFDDANYTRLENRTLEEEAIQLNSSHLTFAVKHTQIRFFSFIISK